jgi:hypothetical protein
MEMQMSPALKNLSFTTITKTDTSPVMMRRREIITRLELQKKLAMDSNFVRTIKTKDGEKQQKVLPMWRLMEDGSYASFLKVGFAPVEWAPGKTAIAVPSLDKLPIIDTLITAVRQGELDEQLRPTKRPAATKPRKT